MQLASGTVINGKIVVEGLSLPEGSVVTVLTRDDEHAVQLSPANEVELLDALDEADREEGVSAQELFARLQLRLILALIVRVNPRAQRQIENAAE